MRAWGRVGFAMVAVLFAAQASAKDADLGKDVAEVAKSRSEGKGLVKNLGMYPATQLVVFQVGTDLNYYIDLRAQLCMVRPWNTSVAMTLVPCPALKKGYPLVAPLITWDD
jgi:hypothetical protein